MKTIPAVKGMREGVEARTGVWSDSDSKVTVGADDDTDLLGMVIFGLGFSIFVSFLIEGPGAPGSSGSILIPKEEIDGVGSESESDSSSLQMGR